MLCAVTTELVDEILQSFTAILTEEANLEMQQSGDINDDANGEQDEGDREDVTEEEEERDSSQVEEAEEPKSTQH